MFAARSAKFAPSWQVTSSSTRPYCDALGEEAAGEELRREAGTQFDPRVVDAFFARWEEIEQFQRQFRRTEAPPADLRAPAIYSTAGR